MSLFRRCVVNSQIPLGGSIVEELVVGRFAPSPTGPLHHGSLVAALGSYLLAKCAAGQWLLRMEDLDTPRVVPGVADDMLRTLELLGFAWDGEVVWQSRRGEAYQAALDQLVLRGDAYSCGCSRVEIARIASAPHGSHEGPVYPGTCRTGLAPGRPARSIRLRVPSEPLVFTDAIQGVFAQNLQEAGGDFVIRRADGLFAYQLAVVVDDAASGVNQVVRGADLLPSTPRQILIQQLLGLPTPAYAHVPLVTGPGGAKLSKRDNAVSLAKGLDLVKHGGAVLCGCLRFLGQQPPAELSRASCREILAWATVHFEPSAIPHQPHQFPVSP